MNFDYLKEFPSAVTVCDLNFDILYMNDKSLATFEKWGGEKLVGKNLFNCHKTSSQEKMKEIIATGIANSYTILKNGQKKLIHQSPWYKDGKIAGLIEISIVLPDEMPHFVR